jgi:hypothetical protein
MTYSKTKCERIWTLPVRTRDHPDNAEQHGDNPDDHHSAMDVFAFSAHSI